MKQKKKNYSNWIFLSAMIFAYIALLFYNKNIFYASLNMFYHILIKIAPIFLFVFFLTWATNYFLTPQFASKYLRKKGKIKWFFAIITGIISTGPIYLWYPLLKQLHTKGLNHGLIACFIYNRAIKLPLLPVAILYFSWPYILILCLIIIAASIIQGKIINWLI